MATVLNENTFENRNLTSVEDTAEGINKYFSNIGLDLVSKTDP